MFVNLGVFEEFEYQVWREYVCKFGILVGDFYKSLFSNQIGYLRPPKRINIDWSRIERCDKRGRTEG